MAAAIHLADGSYTQPTTDFSINLHLTPDAIPSNNKTILHKLDHPYSCKVSELLKICDLIQDLSLEDLIIKY